MKYRRKQYVIRSLLVCLLAGSLSGCSQEETAAQTVISRKENRETEEIMADIIYTQTDHEQELTRIQTFYKEDVAVVPKIKKYEFATAKRTGVTEQMRGILPGTGEGVWYSVLIDGVEYYYGKYDDTDTEDAVFLDMRS